MQHTVQYNPESVEKKMNRFGMFAIGFGGFHFARV